MPSLRSYCLRLVLAAALFTPGVGRGDVPVAVHQQGLLLGANGAPFDGTADIYLQVWSHPTSLDFQYVLYQEKHEDVAVDDGEYAVVLGRGLPQFGALGPSTFGEERWLAVSIDTDGQLFPRRALLSATQALVCGQATSTELATDSSRLGGLPASSWQRRVTGTCAAGSSIASIAVNGTVSCELDDLGLGSIGGVIAGAGLTGGGSAGDVSLAVSAGGVTATKLASGAVTLPKWVAGSLFAVDLAPGSVGTSEIAAGQVTGAKIAIDAVNNLALADNAVTGAAVLDGSLLGFDVASNTVPATAVSDEPGVVSVEALIPDTIGPSGSTLFTATLTLPGPGVVMAEYEVYATHFTDELVTCTLSRGPGAPATQTSSGDLTYPISTVSGPEFALFLSVQTSFGALTGANNFTLSCDTDDDVVDVLDRRLTLNYFPDGTE
jgi:hypothetical protein